MNKFLLASMLVGSLFLVGCDKDEDDGANAVVAPNSCPQGYVITMSGCQKIVTLPKGN